jgi:hypothetical protein
MTIADLDRALGPIERALLDSSNDAGWRRLASLFPQFRWIYLGDYL